jgi:hypothetical protein
MVTRSKNKKASGEKKGKGKEKEKELKLGKETVKELGDEDMNNVAGGLLYLGGARIEGVRDRLAVEGTLTNNCTVKSDICQGTALSCDARC